MDLQQLVRHPAALASGVTSLVVGIVSTIAGIPLVSELTGWLATNALGMFSGVSIFAFTVAPEVGVSPELKSAIQSLALALGIVAGVVRLYGPLKNLKERVLDA